MLMMFYHEEEKKVTTVMVIKKERAFFGYAIRKLGNESDAKEAVGKTNLKLSERFHKLNKEVQEDPDRLAAYTFRILQNTCRDIGKARGGAPYLENIDSCDEVTTDEEAEIGYFVIDGEDVDSAKAALKKLSSRNLDFMVMYYLTKSNHAEIAAEFGISASSVKDKANKLKRRVIMNTKEAKKHA